MYISANYQDAIDNDPAKIIPANQLITDDGDFVTKIFYARFDKGTDCYSIRPINIYLIHLVKILTNLMFVMIEITVEDINLNNYVPQVNNQPGTQVSFLIPMQQPGKCSWY